ncbi:MAG: ABC transporter permease [Lachnospiraceae bacterium]|nr:ABC transporter permease [Lachnospiraceae bacterium]
MNYLFKTISLELKKTKRRGIWMVLTIFLLLITGWTGYNMNDERFLGFGWMMTLYNVPLINAILIPTAIAVFASRIVDIEHKGNTWKMLETMQPKFEIYLGKVFYGFAAILIFSTAELIIFLAMGYAVGFHGTPDLWAYGLFFVQTFSISFNLYLLQMIVSLIFSNQAVALCTGLCGSMAGLFLMYVPQWPFLRNMVPWGHYGASMFVGMDWNKEENIKGFYYMSQNNGVVFFIIGWFFVLMLGGWLVFRHMDTDGFHFSFKYRRPPKHTTNELTDNASPSYKPVKLPHLPVELLKIRRAPIWLAFIVLPLISAVIGTGNYLNNLEILTSTWYSLWTQHALFFCYFFMPPLVGVYASYLWRLEHNGTNWNMILVNTSVWRLVLGKVMVCAAITFLTLGWLCLLYIICGLYAGFTEPVPAELLEWLACGVLGGIAVCAAQCFLSLVIRSFAIPIGMALVGGFAGLAVTAKGHYYLLPYSLMSMGMRANNPDLNVNITTFVSYSIFFTLLFYLLMIWYIRHHDVRTQ